MKRYQSRLKEEVKIGDKVKIVTSRTKGTNICSQNN